jgi:hypothetical protein
MKAYEEARDSEAEQGGSVRPMRGAVKPLFVSGYAGSKQNALPGRAPPEKASDCLVHL